MTTLVEITKTFERESERLARRFPSLEVEVDLLTTQLEQDARPGLRLAGIGYTTYKVRLPNRSARRGKSGGFRVIYYEREATLVTPHRLLQNGTHRHPERSNPTHDR